MATIKSAYVREKKWVDMECDSCGGHYGCLVEASAQADDQFLPFSDNSLKELALGKLHVVQQKRAAGVPCPMCGAYPQRHVDRIQGLVRAVVVWGVGVVFFVTTVGLIARLAPKTPAWGLLIVLAAALIVPRLFCGLVVAKFDPNRNLVRNLQLARAKIAYGTLRLQPPELPPVLDTQPRQ